MTFSARGLDPGCPPHIPSCISSNTDLVRLGGMQHSKGLVNEWQYRTLLTTVYLAARLRICLTLFLSSRRMCEVMKSSNLSVDCCNGKIASGVETSSIVTSRLLGVYPEAIFANLSDALF